MKKFTKALYLTAFILTAVFFIPNKAHAMANARTYPAYARETGYFYEQLSAENKQKYKDYAECMIQTGDYMPSWATFCRYYDHNEHTVNGDENVVVIEDYVQVQCAYELDHPAITSNHTSEAETWQTKKVVDVAKTNALLNQAHGMAAQTVGLDKNERAKLLHDKLVELVTYKHGQEHQTAYGALINHECVCNGYAHAYQLLLNCAGIEAIVQYGYGAGEQHAWNQIQLQDNEWYEVDSTWDDPDDETVVQYTYYLITSAQMDGYFHEHFGRDEELEYDYNPYTGEKRGWTQGYYFRLTLPVSNGTTYRYVEPNSVWIEIPDDPATGCGGLMRTGTPVEATAHLGSLSTREVTETAVTWTTSDSSIIAIEAIDNSHTLEYTKVKLIPQKVGTATIKVKTNKGNAEWECKIVVRAPESDNTQQGNNDNGTESGNTDNSGFDNNNNNGNNTIPYGYTTASTNNKTSKTGNTVKTRTKEVVIITSNKTVKIKEGNKKARTVPETVIINGKKYTVEEIMPGAYKDNKYLKTINIGKKVKKIGDKAFYNCKNAKTITFKGTGKIEIGENAFEKINKKAEFRLKKKAFKSYKKAISASKTVKGAKYKKY
ncbi:transglutaminase domain-containing protein [Butyrivibrio sp. MB2005]|uniref:transglutaminase domain-containing protein n=1 Tax=Butyrivibrio sp. MB2005 TaxID=1280678 RepID=UPI00047DD78D|nr:transglutaminase domain-containing protein [Butyrivibrio sp. MB2005]